MARESVWDDQARDNLRENMKRCILGELRLGRRHPDEIVEMCRDIYMQDVCPEDEWETFIDVAKDELIRASAAFDSEKADWPEETDCDRLDRVESALRGRGFLLWQVSPCCDTCTVSELPDRIDVIEQRFPGFRTQLRGYGFFIDQNMPEMLAEDTRLSAYLAYGWFSPDESPVAPDVYEQKALGIAREICKCLSDEGIEVDWNGDFSRKIGISLNWQRRELLE